MYAYIAEMDNTNCTHQHQKCLGPSVEFALAWSDQIPSASFPITCTHTYVRIIHTYMKVSIELLSSIDLYMNMNMNMNMYGCLCVSLCCLHLSCFVEGINKNIVHIVQIKSLTWASESSFSPSPSV